MLNGLALAATSFAVHLHVLENSRRQHVFAHDDTVAAALGAAVNLAVGAAAAVALFADVLLLDGEFVLVAVVKIAQRNLYLQLHIRASSLRCAPKVPAPAEEAREDVEGIVLTGAAALLMLLEAFVAILIVNAAGLFIREGFVGLRDLDKLPVRRIVTAASD